MKKTARWAVMAVLIATTMIFTGTPASAAMPQWAKKVAHKKNIPQQVAEDAWTLFQAASKELDPIMCSYAQLLEQMVPTPATGGYVFLLKEGDVNYLVHALPFGGEYADIQIAWSGELDKPSSEVELFAVGSDVIISDRSKIITVHNPAFTREGKCYASECSQ